MSIALYTQPNCPYCDIMKGLLDQTGFSYYTINIQENIDAKMFLKDNGHRTVPQLYVNDIHINKRPTEEYTANELYVIIAEAMGGKDESDWPWVDSGIEQGI